MRTESNTVPSITTDADKGFTAALTIGIVIGLIIVKTFVIRMVARGIRAGK